MAYQVLARKWRPQQFDDVVGQEHITQTIKRAIETERVAHAYLFCGPRGVGKTTTARILAKALNCVNGPTPTPCNECSACRGITNGTSMDVIEIDGASNNSVDDVRDLREKINFAPSRGKYKIYIIDEVHMLSNAAFNALLKTLEEPPPHVIFIFATTEVHKILPTILSRCQRFDFKRINIKRIVEWLAYICEQEEIGISEEALYLIARKADGGMRDAESILDKVISYKRKDIQIKDVTHLLGIIDHETLFTLTNGILEKDSPLVLNLLDKIIMSGYDIAEFANGLAEHLRNLLIARSGDGVATLLDMSEAFVETYQKQAKAFTPEDLLRLLKITMDVQQELRRSSQPRLIFEVALVRMTQLQKTIQINEILNRLAALEEKLGTVENQPPVQSSNTSKPTFKAPPQSNHSTPSTEESITYSPITDVKEIWGNLKRKAQVEKKGLATNLNHADLKRIENGNAIIELSKEYENSFVVKNLRYNESFITENLTHLCGQPVRKLTFEFVTNHRPKKEEDPPATPTQRITVAETKQQISTNSDETLTEDYIKKWSNWAVETFTGTI